LLKSNDRLYAFVETVLEIDMAVISDPEASSSFPVNVLVADSSKAWRSCVDVLLAEHPEIRLLGFAINGLDAVKQTKELSPDFLLIDIPMTGASR
jgi:PleD family two-component response regulator